MFHRISPVGEEIKDQVLSSEWKREEVSEDESMIEKM